MSRAARSSSSWIAFGAFGRFRRHQSAAARIWVAASSLTSISSGRLTRDRGVRQAAASSASSCADYTARLPAEEVAPFRHRPRTSRRLQSPGRSLRHPQATRHPARRARQRLFRTRCACRHFTSDPTSPLATVRQRGSRLEV